MKKYPIFVLLIFMACTVFNTAFAQRSILLLGDSVSAGYQMSQDQSWVYLLNKQLQDQKASYLINNASISGETTSGGLSRLKNILETEKVDHLIIELGGNDGLRGYPTKLIKNNLLQMVELAQAKNITVSMIKIKITPNYGPRYLKMFEQVYDEVAAEKNITLMPFFMEKVALNPDLMMSDGIHPNIAAQPQIADFVGKQLQQIMEP